MKKMIVRLINNKNRCKFTKAVTSNLRQIVEDLWKGCGYSVGAGKAMTTESVRVLLQSLALLHESV